MKRRSRQAAPRLLSLAWLAALQVTASYAGDLPVGQATPITRAANAAVLNQLDFTDRASFEAVKRGFIARLDDPKILGKAGHFLGEKGVVHDASKLDFVHGQPAPNTVNPSLWHQSQLLAEPGLYKVADRIFQFRNYDAGTMTLIAGDSVIACMMSSGQTCAAPTRLVVPRSRHDEAVAIAAATANALTVGDPLHPDSKLGPISNRAQYARVQTMIATGIEEGATLVAGGPGRPAGLEQGFYARPTVFVNVHNGRAIARQEIFGPVLAMIPYDTEAEAIEIANDTEYGLAGYVWSADAQRAPRGKPVAHGPRPDQRRADGLLGAVRRLQDFGEWAGIRGVRAIGVPGVQDDCRVSGVAAAAGFSGGALIHVRRHWRRRMAASGWLFSSPVVNGATPVRAGRSGFAEFPPCRPR